MDAADAYWDLDVSTAVLEREKAERKQLEPEGDDA